LKKVVSILLVQFILFSSMGYYFLFELDKMIVRKEMARVLSRDTSGLVCLQIKDWKNNPAFQRKDAKEFLYYGRLYDIVREIDKGGDKLLLCIADTKEDQLFAGFGKVSNQSRKFNLWDHLVSLAVPESMMRLKIPESTSLELTGYSFSKITSVLSDWSPPPKG
jgi:hypothetical protein